MAGGMFIASCFSGPTPEEASAIREMFAARRHAESRPSWGQYNTLVDEYNNLAEDFNRVVQKISDLNAKKREEGGQNALLDEEIGALKQNLEATRRQLSSEQDSARELQQRVSEEELQPSLISDKPIGSVISSILEMEVKVAISRIIAMFENPSDPRHYSHHEWDENERNEKIREYSVEAIARAERVAMYMVVPAWMARDACDDLDAFLGGDLSGAGADEIAERIAIARSYIDRLREGIDKSRMASEGVAPEAEKIGKVQRASDIKRDDGWLERRKRFILENGTFREQSGKSLLYFPMEYYQRTSSPILDKDGNDPFPELGGFNIMARNGLSKSRNLEQMKAQNEHCAMESECTAGAIYGDMTTTSDLSRAQWKRM